MKKVEKGKYGRKQAGMVTGVSGKMWAMWQNTDTGKCEIPYFGKKKHPCNSHTQKTEVWNPVQL